MSIELIVTIVIMTCGAGMLALSAWQSGRPRRDSIRPRWAPWRFLILLSGAVIALAGIHLLSLLGVMPERPPRGF